MGNLLFTKLNDSYAFIRSGGVTKQVFVYERRSKLFAAAGGGYIELMRDNRTSTSAILVELIISDEYKTTEDKLGRLLVERKHAR